LTEPAPKAPRRRLRLALAFAGVALALVALGLFATRRLIARETLSAWLRSKGVPVAAAEIQGFGLNRLAGRLVIGDPAHPDFTAEEAEVGYGLRGLKLEVRSVRLVRPVLRASLRHGRFSAGSLDPLIEALTKGPPQPGAAQPKITVEGGRLLLATDYGPLQIDADGAMAEGRLQRLVARAAPARLRGAGFDVALGAAAVTAQAVGSRLELSLDAPVASARAGGLSADNARLRFTAAGPYPDLAKKREAGAVVAHAELSGGRLAYAGQDLRNGLVSAALTGQVSGWTEDLALAGRAAADLRASGAEAAGGRAGAVRAAASAEDLRWTRKGGDAVRARLAATASLDSFARPDAQLSQVTAAVQGPVALAGRRADFDLTAHGVGRGAWTGLGAPGPQDSAEMAALKRAARGFRFTAPAVRLQGSGGALRARLLQPVRLLPDGGGAIALSPQGPGFRLTASGGGLPKVEAVADRFDLTPGGAEARGRVRAALSLGPVEGGVYDAAGTLRLADGTVSFTGDRCADVAAARLNFGTNDVRKFAARLCPAAGRPLISLKGADWRIAGRAEAVSGDVPFLQARLSRGAGLLDLASVRGVLQTRLTIDRATATDAAPQTRFRPVAVAGEARQAGGISTATLLIRDGGGRPLAHVGLRHEDATGRGGMQVDSGIVRFAQGGLQPVDLSPIAAALGSPAEGEARFTGRFAWTPQAQTSSGVLEVPRLDFQSPAGKVSGLHGRIVFSSLAPLVAAPGQVLEAAQVAVPAAPLTEARAVFALEPEAVQVSEAQAQVGGGVARIEALQVPLTPGRPVRGVLHLEGVQLHGLVEASPFGDKVDLDAKVSGKLPFTLEGDKVRVAGGSLRAVQPGRLSIQRTALTGVQAQGEVSAPGAPAAAAPEPSTDTFSDFAYQAMENLAFTTLSATVDSRPDGRLGVVFHIIGKHDPPQHQEIRLSWLDLIQKKFMNRKLPLPSGTGVDLTLDTTLNLDDLLGDYAEFRRLHGSAQVQP
jgi:hypothetical protein